MPSDPDIRKDSCESNQRRLIKGILGGLQRSPRKYPKKSKNNQKGSKMDILRLFQAFAGTLLQTANRGPKQHMNFININFLGPTPEKKICASFPAKGRKKGTHKTFFGGTFGVKKGVPNRPFSATKNLVYCYFPALDKRPFLS